MSQIPPTTQQFPPDCTDLPRSRVPPIQLPGPDHAVVPLAPHTRRKGSVSSLLGRSSRLSSTDSSDDDSIKPQSPSSSQDSLTTAYSSKNPSPQESPQTPPTIPLATIQELLESSTSSLALSGGSTPSLDSSRSGTDPNPSEKPPFVAPPFALERALGNFPVTKKKQDEDA